MDSQDDSSIIDNNSPETLKHPEVVVPTIHIIEACNNQTEISNDVINSRQKKSNTSRIVTLSSPKNASFIMSSLLRPNEKNPPSSQILSQSLTKQLSQYSELSRYSSQNESSQASHLSVPTKSVKYSRKRPLSHDLSLQKDGKLKVISKHSAGESVDLIPSKVPRVENSTRSSGSSTENPSLTCSFEGRNSLMSLETSNLPLYTRLNLSTFTSASDGISNLCTQKLFDDQISGHFEENKCSSLSQITTQNNKNPCISKIVSWQENPKLNESSKVESSARHDGKSLLKNQPDKYSLPVYTRKESGRFSNIKIQYENIQLPKSIFPLKSEKLDTNPINSVTTNNTISHINAVNSGLEEKAQIHSIESDNPIIKNKSKSYVLEKNANGTFKMSLNLQSKSMTNVSNDTSIEVKSNENSERRRNTIVGQLEDIITLPRQATPAIQCTGTNLSLQKLIDFSTKMSPPSIITSDGISKVTSENLSNHQISRHLAKNKCSIISQITTLTTKKPFISKIVLLQDDTKVNEPSEVKRSSIHDARSLLKNQIDSHSEYTRKKSGGLDIKIEHENIQLQNRFFPSTSRELNAHPVDSVITFNNVSKMDAVNSELEENGQIHHLIESNNLTKKSESKSYVLEKNSNGTFKIALNLQPKRVRNVNNHNFIQIESNNNRERGRNRVVMHSEDIINLAHEATPVAKRIEKSRRVKKEKASIKLFEKNLNDIEEHNGGRMTEICQHCNAKHFRCEIVSNKKNSFNECCEHGKVKLQSLPELPQDLKLLFDGMHPKSNKFFQRIRYYNSCFAFASFNANLLNFSNRRPGPYCFRIQGQIYYQFNSTLYPIENELPRYGQLFIIDSAETIEILQQTESSLDEEILQIINSTMRNINPFVESYQMMHEEVESENNRRRDNGESSSELQLQFTSRSELDRNRYNPQRCNEVAAVFSTAAGGEIPETYVAIRVKDTKELKILSSMDRRVEPWIYPLFYPYGTEGWHKDLTSVDSGRKMTRAAYTKYRLAVRETGSNVLLQGRRLFQQWIVDQYVKVEKDRFRYIEKFQTKLRADNYTGLLDYLQKSADDRQSRIGKVVILPSTFTGSPRYMMQNYQDAMAMVRKFGKPDLFITMTCNPKWKEIKDSLEEHQTASDRPDITARVFDMKKKHLMDLILTKKIFGDVVAYVYVIESQKRGLLHVHLLVTLKNKLKTPEMIDSLISAEIPDPTENPRLFEIVKNNMIHGPCAAWCQVNGKCSKHFPKSFNEKTTLDEDSYPTYRRRDTGLYYEKANGYVYDNKWVVPYNPALSLILNCHINVEVVSSINAPKYLFTYLWKGHDRAALEVTNHSLESRANPEQENVIIHDEIKDFIDARYVGPNEAVWRILGREIQKKSHSVVRLQIHLPNQQNIILPDDMNEETIRNAMHRSSKLLEFFALNSRDEAARQYTYTQIPNYYTWVKGKWQTRKTSFNVLGRMYSVPPNQVELYHLRVLLLHIKGPTSFNDLRTVDGLFYNTFVETCLARGLIEDDHEWRSAMSEASIWMMPYQLRRLFVRLLIHCNPLYPADLWDEFKENMSQDYKRRVDGQTAERKAYVSIAKMISEEGKDISEFQGMEQVAITDFDDNIVKLEEFRRTGEQNYGNLNDSQRKIVDDVLTMINDDNGDAKCIYIDGPGGSGKTFTYTTLYHLLKARNKTVSTMAFTGIAATLLPEGRTAHKTFGLPVPLEADSTSSFLIESREAERLKSIDVFIWDEAPMAPKYALEVADRSLRDIMNNDKPFGGKMFILGGDFRQLLPVLPNSTRNEAISLSIKYSHLWCHFKKYTLTQNMRVRPDEIEFSKFLLKVGDGVLNDVEDKVEVPEEYIAPPNGDIVHDTYAQLIKDKKYKELAHRAILSARNDDVYEINENVINLLDEETEKIYTSVDSADEIENDKLTEVLLPEFLNTLSPRSLPAHEIRLRRYSIVMLIRNLSINEGLCNGTRLIVLELGTNLLRCEILTGDKKGEVVFLNRITLSCENDYPFVFRRRQFPIKLAFAMTINKAQGQTFETISIDLQRDVFTHGQLYVAFSRVRSWDSLKIYMRPDRNTNKVDNPVYTELFE